MTKQIEQKKTIISNYGGLEITQNIALFVFSKVYKVWTMRLGVFMHAPNEIIGCLVTHCQTQIKPIGQ